MSRKFLSVQKRILSSTRFRRHYRCRAKNLMALCVGSLSMFVIFINQLFTTDFDKFVTVQHSFQNFQERNILFRSFTANNQNFSFPSREERLRYYMGDWYNRTLEPKYIDCSGIERVDVLTSNKNTMMSTEWVMRQIREHRAQKYLTYAMEVVRGAGQNVEQDFNRFIMVVGDAHCHNDRLPSAAKSRYNYFAIDKKTRKPFFMPIMWPLNLIHHYGPVDKYISLLESSKITKWENKKPTLIWRGDSTGIGLHHKYVWNTTNCGRRVHTVRKYFFANQSDVDIAFSNVKNKIPGNCVDVEQLVRASHTSMEDQLKFKYILSIEGNDVATGLKWQMASNSVVFMPNPMLASFFMEDLLVPFVHYVPMNDDLSNLVEMVEWARENDEKCRWISEQATKYVENVWTSEHAREDMAFIQQELGKAYYYQFENAVKSCVPKVVGVPSISNSFE